MFWASISGVLFTLLILPTLTAASALPTRATTTGASAQLGTRQTSGSNRNNNNGSSNNISNVLHFDTGGNNVTASDGAASAKIASILIVASCAIAGMVIVALCAIAGMVIGAPRVIASTAAGTPCAIAGTAVRVLSTVTVALIFYCCFVQHQRRERELRAAKRKTPAIENRIRADPSYDYVGGPTQSPFLGP